MPEIAVAWKIVGALYALLTGGVWWWITDLRNKQVRFTTRIDSLSEKVGEQRERITRLESETISEVEVERRMAEMERRIMNNFKEFRLEFKEDLSEFRTYLREDMKELKRSKE